MGAAQSWCCGANSRDGDTLLAPGKRRTNGFTVDREMHAVQSRPVTSAPKPIKLQGPSYSSGTMESKYEMLDEIESTRCITLSVGTCICFCLQAKFGLRFPRWATGLSESAKDLLRHLLEVDSSKRYTADQALAHPWVTGARTPNKFLKSPNYLRTIKQEQISQKMKGRVNGGDEESEDEWKPNAPGEASEDEDGELSDSDSSEEEMAKRRVRATRAAKRKVIESDSSDQEKPKLKAKMKMKRVKPPSNHTLNNFFDEIMEWKFFEALRREAQSGYSFSAANDGSEEGEVEVAVEKVPSKFHSYEHYFSVWRPLALEEVQAQTINSVTTDRPNPVSITAKGFGATFISKSCKIRVDPKKQSGPGMKRNSGRENLSDLFVNDLVLITPDLQYLQKGLASVKESQVVKIEEGEEETPDNPPVGFLAIVVSQRGSKEGLTMTILRSGWGALEKETDIYLFKLNNLVTSVREFRALCDCSHYGLMPLLLSGEHKQGSMRLDSLGLKYVQWLNKTFNDSQREAIAAAATSEGFTLIKGPPGTGKTTTLKGLLNSLHLREYNRYYNAVLDVARRPDSETAKAWAQVGNEKPHILVTAPSNAAVDNIVAKVIEEGFCDGEGRRYFPKIVRVGRGLSANVRSVGLDDMVDQICSQPLDVLEGHIARLRHELMVVECDSLHLREQLRQIVAWIEQDPIAALAELAQVQAQQNAATASPAIPNEPASPPPPPPLDMPFASSTEPVQPSPPPGYPDSPPPPPSPPGPAFPEEGANGMVQTEYPEQEEEEDEDEAFPTTFGAPPPAWDEQEEAFNAEASGKALNAFLDDGSISEEDEPLPIGGSTPDRNEDQEELDEPFPVAPHLLTNTTTSSSLITKEESGEANVAGSATQPIQVDGDGDDTPEEDEPLAGLDPNVKLELQRYEFARKAVSEMGGKRSQSTRQSLEVSFLDTAHIVFTTLSSAGVAALDASTRYDILVVDEAAQAVELSTIIPMNHPLISDFPRHYFYEGKLQDGDNVKGEEYSKPYHSLGPAFLPLVFWDLLSSREKATKSVSRMNVGEAELAVNLYLTLKNSCPPDAIAGKVGMITPYSQQMEELRNRFRRALGERYEQEVEINTVDGFQGREKDIIILSTVRADPKAGVGFLNDIRRMNVALTRANGLQVEEEVDLRVLEVERE
ncbi:hypothetical protein BBJ29_003259 [Phytophthora kernoviae]|uniref:Helicase ATP-binding domain-containing protein n=1 Tax=Phytophthora kernoviae TaxID=325452 RepID=A0A3F2RMD5_9STRA|nr:hypothetical protein BBJ29_003259 [Phytophthora kernoviae]RLN60383.1 hypothetical protein BBP00_00006014 [Phytophthora kernoviae]